MRSDTNSNTNLLRFINQWGNVFQVKLWLFQKYFSTSVFIFFLGFICGNLFGSFLIFFRNWLPWDGFIILMTILTIEWINYLYFHVAKSSSTSLIDPLKIQTKVKKKKSSLGWEIVKLKTKNFVSKNELDAGSDFPINFTHFIRLINFYKLGLLLGFFIDAFKVGS